MSKPLYLYLVERTDEPGYDEHDSGVVAAHTKPEAMLIYGSVVRSTAPMTAKLIGTALHGVEPGIVLTSFNAA